MSKPKGPTFAQQNDENVETRQWTGTQGPSTMGRSIVYITCPFCRAEVTAYQWSLSGGGKRCGCGALFGAYGNAYHFLDAVV